MPHAAPNHVVAAQHAMAAGLVHPSFIMQQANAAPNGAALNAAYLARQHRMAYLQHHTHASTSAHAGGTTGVARRCLRGAKGKERNCKQCNWPVKDATKYGIQHGKRDEELACTITFAGSKASLACAVCKRSLSAHAERDEHGKRKSCVRSSDEVHPFAQLHELYPHHQQ
jgi:hypothetical protein